MKNRSELREIIMKVLYQISIFKETKLDYDIGNIIKEQLEVKNEFVNKTIDGILKHEDKIVSLADKYLKDWQMSRLNKVDQAIIKIGIYELMYTDTPSVVSINEAIDLSHKYSDEQVTKMINGVLDKIYHEEVKTDE